MAANTAPIEQQEIVLGRRQNVDEEIGAAGGFPEPISRHHLVKAFGGARRAA